MYGLSGTQAARASLPLENVGLCWMAFWLGTVVSLTLLCVFAVPVFGFLQRKQAQRLDSEKVVWPRATTLAASGLLGVTALAVVAGIADWQRFSMQNAAAKTLDTNSSRTATIPLGNVQNFSLADFTTAKTVFTRLQFSSSTPVPRAGQRVDWTIKVNYREDNEPVSDFTVVHAKKLHMVVASSDLSWYTHIHPVFQGKGIFKIHTQLPRAGHYRFYADYTPDGLRDHEVAVYEFEVKGDKPLPNTPVLTPDVMRDGWLTNRSVAAPEGLPDAIGGPTYEVGLMLMPDVIRVGEPIMLHFQVRDDKGQPLDDLQPYMGALGHCVILDNDVKNYLHVHPMQGQHMMEMMKMDVSQMMAKMAQVMKTEKPLPPSFRGGPNVMFHTVFLKPGQYKAWAQFQRAGKIITAPFVVNVLGPAATIQKQVLSFDKNQCASPEEIRPILIVMTFCDIPN